MNKLGIELRFYSFISGADISYFMEKGYLNAGYSGDMPTITLATTSDIVVAAITNMGYTAVIAKQPALIKELKGKKIGYGFGSNAHYALMSALAQEGLSENDVTMVRMRLLDMPDALKNNKVFAFSAWEPIATTTTRVDVEAFAIHKTLTTGYIFFRKSLYENQPEAVNHILAAEVRAIRWLLHSKENRTKASSWVMQSVNSLYAKQSLYLTEDLISEVSLKMLLNITSSPLIPENLIMEGGPMYHEFIFLKKVGLLPFDADWNKVHDSFTNAALLDVLKKSYEYRLNEFKYSQQDLTNE
jgi:ABC-type nitrate/sulfonate/bicarbonate transport system substrate-binding protein